MLLVVPSVVVARVLVFSVRNIAAVRLSLSFSTSHFVPNSYVFTSSGFKLLIAAVIPSEPSPPSTPTGFDEVA